MSCQYPSKNYMKHKILTSHILQETKQYTKLTELKSHVYVL